MLNKHPLLAYNSSKPPLPKKFAFSKGAPGRASFLQHTVFHQMTALYNAFGITFPNLRGKIMFLNVNVLTILFI